MGQLWRWFGFLFFLIISAQLVGLPPAVADELADILKEKGVITKEDWVRAKAKEEKQAEEQRKRLAEEFPVKADWGEKGFTLATRDGKWKTAIQFRLQFRYTNPDDGDPDRVSDFISDIQESTFEIRRARLKVGGHGYQPWLKYYFEIDWQPLINSGGSSASASTRLIDWRVMLEKYRFAQLRLGQWKINYNRERVDSSGQQQFVERSIVNGPFTIDRQVGTMLYGHLFPGTMADGWYYAGVYTGSGRGERNDDENMMYHARAQWNFFGRDLKFSQSDVEYHERPAGSIAWAGATNIGKCTRWSSSGCGTLVSDNNLGNSYTSDSAALPGQFRIDQQMTELAFKWRGFSLQSEYHWKQVKDAGRPGGAGLAAAPSKTNLMGTYINVGYFFHYLIPVVPKPLEMAFRYAFVDPNVSVSGDKQQEFTGVINWFFAGHRNKLTADYSYLTLDQPGTTDQGNALTENRVRLQWDVSF